MPFKIVQTCENNSNRLFTIPSPWEDKNILKWPLKQVTKLIKNEFSTPEGDWREMKCVVKRRHIPTYEIAEYVLGEMVNHEDTEDDPIHLVSKQKPLQDLNLNAIADEIVSCFIVFILLFLTRYTQRP